MYYVLIVLTALWLVIYYEREDLRRELVTAGLMAGGVMLLISVLNETYLLLLDSNVLSQFIFQTLLFSFFFGGIAAVAYEVFLHKKLVPIPHPKRHELAWLWVGPVIASLLILSRQTNLSLAIVIGLTLELIILVTVRKDLIWDALLSGVLLGLLYTLIVLIGFRIPPGSFTNFWIGETLSGVTFGSLPIEELILVFLFGALWGPLYEGLKGLKTK